MYLDRHTFTIAVLNMIINFDNLCDFEEHAEAEKQNAKPLSNTSEQNCEWDAKSDKADSSDCDSEDEDSEPKSD